MTNNDQDRSITPMATGEEGGDSPLGPIRDPLADATDGLGNDPSLGELIAVRDHAPDLKVVAREATGHDNGAPAGAPLRFQKRRESAAGWSRPTRKE